MPDTRTCPSCGEPLPAGAPDGPCGRCYLDSGLAKKPAAGDAVPERYEVLADEGGGTYRARDRESGAVVGLRVVKQPAGDFATRAEALRAHPHAGIARVLDHGAHHLATEYVEGRALAELRLSPREALRVAEQVCAALGHAADHGAPLDGVDARGVRVLADGAAKIAHPLPGEATLDAAAVGALFGAAPAVRAPATEAAPPAAPATRAARARNDAEQGRLAIVASAGLILLIGSVVPWASSSWEHMGRTRTASVNGWETEIGYGGSTILPFWLVLAVGLLTNALAIARRTGRLDVSWKVLLGAALFGAAGCLAWWFVVLSLDGVSIGPGVFLALAAFATMSIASASLRPTYVPKRRPRARPRPRRRKARRRS